MFLDILSFSRLFDTDSESFHKNKCSVTEVESGFLLLTHCTMCSFRDKALFVCKAFTSG